MKIAHNYQFILTFVACITLYSTMEAQRNFDTVQVRANQLSDAVWMLTGSGGNIGVSSGEDGIVIIDDQFAALSDKIKKAVAEIAKSSAPIKFVVNTHWHGDHTGGNENMGKDGAVIIAHESVRKRMSEGHFNEFTKSTIPASPKMALPVVTFTEDITLHLNGDDVQIFHVNPAHTDGDAIIYFTKANIVHMGDVFFWGSYPFIDISSGGSINGLVAAVDRVLPMLNEDVKIIPGHGTLANKDNLRSYRDMLASVRDAVVAMIRRGKSLDEVKAARPTKEFDAQWGKGSSPPDRFVEIVYQSLAKK
jgi:cyclase